MATAPTFNNSYFITNRNDPTTIWVDSSSVVIPVHGSYRSLPQTLVDMSTTMNSSNPTYSGRILYPGGTNTYYLNPAVNTGSGIAPPQGIYRRAKSRAIR